MSSDELANFDMKSPQVAGPSTLPSNKRKTALDSKKSGPVARKKPSQRREETIELSSENEPPPPPPPRQKARRGKATSVSVATNGHTNGRSILASKRSGKSPPPTLPLERIIANGKDNDGSLSENVDEDEHKIERKTILHNSDKSRADKPMARLQKMYEDVVKQRDEFARQFEQLSQLRHTDAEKLLHEQQLQYEARLKAQQESIHELQVSFNRLDTLPNSGKGPLHFLTREAAERERQDVQRELSKLRNTLKEKDTLLNEKDQELVRLNDNIKTTRLELDMEIENSKRMAARTAPASLSKTSGGKLDSRNALIVRLYEELTGILITNVKHDPGKFKDDDAIFTCVQTTRNGTSLQFTLKYTADTNDDGSVSETVIYTPLNLDKESQSFIEQLNFLATPFTFEKDQMQVFSQTLTSHLEGNNGDDNDTSRMEE